MDKHIKKSDYFRLVDDIGALLADGRKAAIAKVNRVLVETYWHVGHKIVMFEQMGKIKAEYGSTVLAKLATDLRKRYGKGFSKSNVYLMRQLYIKFEKFQTLSGKLSWSHYFAGTW